MGTKKEVKWIDGRLWAEDCLAMELMGFADEFFKTENSADAVSFLQEWISELSDEVLEAHLKRLNPLILRCTREQAMRPAEEKLEELFNGPSAEQR